MTVAGERRERERERVREQRTSLPLVSESGNVHLVRPSNQTEPPGALVDCALETCAHSH